MNFRKNIRLKYYNYQQNGFYFVTICTSQNESIINNNEKKLIELELDYIPIRFSGVYVYYYIIMSDHIHLVFEFYDSKSALNNVIQAFKSITTLKIKRDGFSKKRFWQPNYYEHVIRNETALNKITAYIKSNPIARELKLEEIYGENAK